MTEALLEAAAAALDVSEAGSGTDPSQPALAPGSPYAAPELRDYGPLESAGGESIQLP